MFHNRRIVVFSMLAAATMSVPPAMAQRHERKQAEMEASAQAKPVAGGVTFQVALPLDRCFDAVLNVLKRNGHEIESASKDAGTIVTAMEIAGKHSQTGTRYHVVLIKDGETQTSLRVAVTVQKRKKLLQAEPWSDPKLDEPESTKAAAELQEALKPL